MVLKDRTKITGNSNTNDTSNGGGVGVYKGGILTMEGGTISGNSDSCRGGGVWVKYGTFTKQAGGTIYGSNASGSLKNTTRSGNSYGYAVYVWSGKKKRNATAGSGITLDSKISGRKGGWE
jgi:hypothetical protein